MLSQNGLNLSAEYAGDLEISLQGAYSQLTAAAKSDSFLPEIVRIYGGSGDSSRLQELVDSWASGDFSQLPSIEILSGNSLNGANGAFSETTSTIYLSSDFLSQSLTNRDVLGPTGLLIEEIGHFVDTIINPGNDTAGDEGALFSATVMGIPLNRAQRYLINSEDDHGFVNIDNQAIAVEQAQPSTTKDSANARPVLYVATNGNNNNPGTIDRPFKTINKAVSMIGDGEGGVINVRAGTYANTAVWIGNTNDGSSTSPLVIQPYLNEKVNLKGVSSKDVIGVGGQHVTIKGFNIGNGAKGIVGVKAQNLQVLNNTVHDVTGHGIGIYGNDGFGTSNISVSGNTVYNTALANKSGTADSWASGITISRGKNASVTNNRVYQNYGEGITITLSDNVTVSNNTAYDNFSVGGVYLDNATKTTVENNFIYSTGNSNYFKQLNIGQGEKDYPGYGIYMNNEKYSNMSNPNSDNIIRNNIISGTLAGIAKTNQAKNTLIANNTISGSVDRELVIFTDRRDANIRITNNIFSGSTSRSANWFSGNPTDYTFSNNLWSEKPTLAARGRGDIYGSAQLANPGGSKATDYKIKTTSPAINAGLTLSNVKRDYFGDNRAKDGENDIGADEVS
ncbi:MAG: right-handed parallel beta-helix repeat-containing protein [Aphanocapsa sp. GSE-SYN-MK-11-07L]|jgi:parallel beta-helix repeat protein|nr:right-handed parallel beta-helix repeat-containing protein [Aphanocapsa sp. GSE-SYN-MK-11-07L]